MTIKLKSLKIILVNNSIDFSHENNTGGFSYLPT